jgi:chromosome segregation ATPase
MEAMTTPPPVTTGAPEAMVETYDSLLQTPKKAGLVQKEARQNKKKGPSLQALQRALAKMVNSVWVDPASKKALGQINGFMQADGMEEPAAADATPAPTVEVSQEAFQGMQQNTENNLAAFEMLKGKAEESLTRLRNNDLQDKHNHDLRIQSLLDGIHLSEDKLEDVKRDRSRLSEEKARAESEKADTEASKAASEKALAGVQLTCDKAAGAWAARQKGAKEEMAAIAKAKDILASRVTVLVQSQPDNDADVSKQSAKLRESLVAHFRKLGSDLHSLAMLNLVSVASSEPMAQVKQLLKDLTSKLEKEAAEAANLHEFCKEEKKKTTDAKDKKDMVIETLETRLDKANAKKTQLEEDVATLSEEVSSIDNAQAEALKIRTEDHNQFQKTEADLKEAADAVGDAMDALKDYYGDSSLVQVEAFSGQPKLGGAKSDSAGGILSILDMMQGEFMKQLAAAQSDEREAVKAYEAQTTDFRVSKAAKEQEIKGAESEVKSLTVAIHNFAEDHKMASAELSSIMDYMDKLKPQCEGRVTPYEERKARREAEIQGLKDALSIIEKDAPSFVQIRRLRH